jgi:hypothetical protein
MKYDSVVSSNANTPLTNDRNRFMTKNKMIEQKKNNVRLDEIRLRNEIFIIYTLHQTL